MKSLRFNTKANTTITSRELEVLHLVSLGYCTKEIAKALFLSHWTIHDHKKSMMLKLNSPTAASAVRRGFELGLLSTHNSETNNLQAKLRTA